MEVVMSLNRLEEAKKKLLYKNPRTIIHRKNIIPIGTIVFIFHYFIVHLIIKLPFILIFGRDVM